MTVLQEKLAAALASEEGQRFLGRVAAVEEPAPPTAEQVAEPVAEVAPPSPTAVTWENYHEGTHAIFTPAEAPEREPDFVSESGSEYWNEGEGVIRRSDHWGTAIGQVSWYYSRAGLVPLEELREYRGYLAAARVLAEVDPGRAADLVRSARDPFLDNGRVRDTLLTPPGETRVGYCAFADFLPRDEISWAVAVKAGREDGWAEKLALALTGGALTLMIWTSWRSRSGVRAGRTTGCRC